MTSPTTNQPVDPAKQHQTLSVSSSDVQGAYDAKMLEIRLAENEKVAETKAQTLGLSYIELAKMPILPEAISLLDEATATTQRLVCFIRNQNEVKLAAQDPTDPAVKQTVQQLADQGYNIELYLVSAHGIDQALQFYRSIPKVRKLKLGVSISDTDLAEFKGQFSSFADLAKRIRTVSLTKLVTFVIASALEGRASDIHIEAEETGVKIRFRIDGILHDIVELPIAIWEKLASRIKLLANLKMNVKSKPQDGGFSIEREHDKVDVRVSAIPTNFGESIVLRLLMSSSAAINFDDLGLRGKAYSDLERELRKPNGMIITTGPTGSGKTTTLYAALNRLNDEETKIITLEDPIEYKLSGINQSQVHTDEGYTFAKGLRSILRQDPDVIMVGEIRDLDTAETAINAALTGHLVISTLHTNSAAAAIPRFLSMNVKPFLLAPALNAVMGQRLVRRICPACKTEAEIDNQTMSEVIAVLSKLTPESGERNRAQDPAALKFYKGKGCVECHGIGYQGRIGIYEIMAMTPEIEKLILAGQVSEFQIQELAITKGMVTMMQDGLLKALEGITTVEDVFRVAKLS